MSSNGHVQLSEHQRLKRHATLLLRALDETEDVALALVTAEIGMSLAPVEKEVMPSELVESPRTSEQRLPAVPVDWAAFSLDSPDEPARSLLAALESVFQKLSASVKEGLEAALSSNNLIQIAHNLVGFVGTYRVLIARYLSQTQLAALLIGMKEIAQELPPLSSLGGGAPLPPSLPPKQASSLLERLEDLPTRAREKEVYELPAAEQQWVRQTLSAREALPPIKPVPLPKPEAGSPEAVHFPMIDEAVRLLKEKNVLSDYTFSRLAETARERASTISGTLAQETLEKLRDLMAENVKEGVGFEQFRKAAMAETEAGSLFSKPQLEVLFRTNTHQALSDGKLSLVQHPFVRSGFPYAAYYPIDDGRVRPEHLALGHLGIEKTAIYRIDDPVFQTFRPPWSWNCRCGWSPITIASAAQRGVEEAKKWLETGVEPTPPARVAWPPFQPPQGFQREGVSVPLSISMSMSPFEGLDGLFAASSELLTPAIQIGVRSRIKVRCCKTGRKTRKRRLRSLSASFSTEEETSGPRRIPVPPEIFRMAMQGWKAVIDHETGEWVVGDDLDVSSQEVVLPTLLRKQIDQGAQFGMIGDEWHGPEAPGENWVMVRQGPRGGKVWKHKGGGGGATEQQGQGHPQAQEQATKPKASPEARQDVRALVRRQQEARLQRRLQQPPETETKTWDKADVDSQTSWIFPGQNITAADLGKMVGAQNGSTVMVGKSYSGGIQVSVDHPYITDCSRRIYGTNDGKVVCKNEVFFLRRKYRRGGFGMAQFSDQVRNCAEMGVDRIETCAGKGSGMNGYATWPILGYDGSLDEARRQGMSRLPGEFEGARTIQELFDLPGGLDWWCGAKGEDGKRRGGHGVMMSMTFDLSPDSRSMKRLNARLVAQGKPPIDVEVIKKVRAQKAQRQQQAKQQQEEILVREADAYWGGRARDQGLDPDELRRKTIESESLILGGIQGGIQGRPLTPSERRDSAYRFAIYQMNGRRHMDRMADPTFEESGLHRFWAEQAQNAGLDPARVRQEATYTFIPSPSAADGISHAYEEAIRRLTLDAASPPGAPLSLDASFGWKKTGTTNLEGIPGWYDETTGEYRYQEIMPGTRQPAKEEHGQARPQKHPGAIVQHPKPSGQPTTQDRPPVSEQQKKPEQPKEKKPAAKKEPPQLNSLQKSQLSGLQSQARLDAMNPNHAVNRLKSQLSDFDTSTGKIKTIRSTKENPLTAADHEEIAAFHARVGGMASLQGNKEAATANFEAAALHRQSAEGKKGKPRTKSTAHGKAAHFLDQQLAKSKGLSDEAKKAYTESYEKVLARMPQKAVERMQGHLHDAEFFKDTTSLSNALADIMSPEKKAKYLERVGLGRATSGCYSQSGGKGKLWLDGLTHQSGRREQTDIHGTYAHEMSHAIDSGYGKWEHSSTQEWLEAAREEIDTPDEPIGKYSRSSTSEAWAEFGRLVYSGVVPLKEIEQEMPKASAYWKKQGFWPDIPDERQPNPPPLKQPPPKPATIDPNAPTGWGGV